jgi:starch phosphorylase
MFARYTIDSITNGVHAATWTAEPFKELYERYIQGWEQENLSLRYALNIPVQKIWRAHAQAKERLISQVNRETALGMDANIFTIGFDRQA